VIDVGAGAGFPGVVLKIAQPHIQLTLVEATRKKAGFLRHLVQALGLEQVTVLAERIETVGQDHHHRAGYDLAVARAVAALPVLAEYMLPLLRIGGQMLAQKGVDPADEVQAAANVLRTLGGRHQQTIPVTVPHVDAARNLVLIAKVAATPKAYPRRPGQPAKNPL
jgi:16S rRNA (guanine527-N7)-methyltransferase